MNLDTALSRAVALTSTAVVIIMVAATYPSAAQLAGGIGAGVGGIGGGAAGGSAGAGGGTTGASAGGGAGGGTTGASAGGDAEASTTGASASGEAEASTSVAGARVSANFNVAIGDSEDGEPAEDNEPGGNGSAQKQAAALDARMAKLGRPVLCLKPDSCPEGSALPLTSKRKAKLLAGCRTVLRDPDRYRQETLDICAYLASL